MLDDDYEFPEDSAIYSDIKDDSNEESKKKTIEVDKTYVKNAVAADKNKISLSKEDDSL